MADEKKNEIKATEEKDVPPGKPYTYSDEENRHRVVLLDEDDGYQD